MRRIAIYSGCFDPITNGHLWVIREGSKMFHELYVLVGTHSGKTRLFSPQESLEMLNETIANYNNTSTMLEKISNVTTGLLNEQSIVQYADRFDGSAQSLQQMASWDDNVTEVTLLRGIRDARDLNYENGIQMKIHRLNPNLHQALILPPRLSLQEISSSEVRRKAKNQDWKALERMVPHTVLKRLKERYPDDVQWEKPERAIPSDFESIFETTTAGFGPTIEEPSTFQSYREMGKKTPAWIRNVMTQSSNGHRFELEDEIIVAYPDKSINVTFFGKMRQHYDNMINNGFVKYAETISKAQVMAMLDPFPYNVAVSEEYHLRPIATNKISTIGGRHLACSQSLGPIIVDSNKLPDVAEFKGLGPILCIEGKHRLLDAIDNGTEMIMAWVGKEVKDE